MYRLLDADGENRERRDQLIHPPYRKPELLATGPNQLWSWDITKLRGPVKWNFYYLYVILDVFSRYVTGWMISYRETAGLARQLIENSCEKQRITPGQLTIHADGRFGDDLEVAGFTARRSRRCQDPQPPHSQLCLTLLDTLRLSQRVHIELALILKRTNGLQSTQKAFAFVSVPFSQAAHAGSIPSAAP
jgi:hypothetical protein